MATPYITVLTPTYNRAETLPALAASLERQTFPNFEWLVVDDGSTDGSPALLARLSREMPFATRIIRQENGGKHRALNRGVPETAGAWIFIVDSDDTLPEESLEVLAALARRADDIPEAGGVSGLRATMDGRRIGSDLPVREILRDAASLSLLDGVTGDKAEAFKKSVLLRHPFPEFPGENFLTENVVWFRIARGGWKLLLSNKILYLCEYRPDGLSAKSLSLRLENPRGTLLYYRETVMLPFPARRILRPALNLVRFAVHFGKFRSVLADLPPSRGILAVLLLPAGLLAALSDRIRTASKIVGRR